jgi:hypothetical protein
VTKIDTEAPTSSAAELAAVFSRFFLPLELGLLPFDSNLIDLPLPAILLLECLYNFGIS